MKPKFDIKTSKVKSICFNQQRMTQVAIGLFTGETQVWDFRNGLLVSEFKESDSCIRSVDFHPLKSLLVAGGDDMVIKGYDTSLNKKTFELRGHADFIRSVNFHHELPWLLSCSDDQTIRIWNWQSKTQLTVITGHDHYIMCARFHKSKDLIVSASLDSTFRIWDFSKLKSKFSTSHGSVYLLANDVEPITITEAHTKGVNWADFHPLEDLIVTCSDDKLIKLWKFTSSHAFEQQAFHGHTNNVSCVAFTRDGSRVLSNSEDGTLRLWDLQGNQLAKFSRGDEKLWVLAFHPYQALAAIGGDSSLVMVAMNSEKIPVRSMFRGGLVLQYSHKHSEIVFHSHAQGRIGSASVFGKLGLDAEKFNVRSIVTNQFSHQKREVGGLLTLRAKNSKETKLVSFQISLTDFSFKGSVIEGERAVFLGAEKILIKRGRKAGIFKWPGLTWLHDCYSEFDACFDGTSGCALLLNKDVLALYDFAAEEERWQVRENEFKNAKEVVWNAKRSHFIVLAGHHCFLLDRKGNFCSSAKEDSKIRSACWYGTGVVLYNTHEHLKFLLLNNDGGIVKSTDKTFSILSASPDYIRGVDVEDEVLNFETDMSEIEFKSALVAGDSAKIRSLLDTHKFLGKAMTSYLLKRGSHKLALQMTSDRHLGFELALSADDLDAAGKLAATLDDPKLYRSLGERCEALGLMSAAESAFKKAYEKEKLPFVLAIAGRKKELQNLVTDAEKDSVQRRFAATLFSGDVRARVKLLADAGQTALAYGAAEAHGLHDLCESLLRAYPELARIEKVPASQLTLGPLMNGSALPDSPVLLPAQESFPIVKEVSADEDLESEFRHVKETPTSKSEEGSSTFVPTIDIKPEEANEEWGIEEPDVEDVPAEKELPASSEIAFVKQEHPLIARIRKSSLVAWEHFAIGDFQRAIALLRNQIGLKTAAPFKQLIAQLLRTQVSVPSAFGIQPSRIRIATPDQLYSKFNPIQLKSGYEAILSLINKAKIKEALSECKDLMLSTLFCQVSSAAELNFVSSIQSKLLKIRIALDAKLRFDSESDPKRKVELALLMSHAQIEPQLRVLFLRVAIVELNKRENFLHVVYLIRRLLKSVEEGATLNEDSLTKMRTLLKTCEAKGSNKIEFDFKEKTLYESNDEERVDLADMRFFEAKEETVSCQFDGSYYKASMKGQLSSFCECCEIGFEGVGLKLLN